MNENQNQGQRVNTSTQVRNLYSDGVSYLNIKFYNTNLSFQFHPFQRKDQNGRSVYDQQKALMTTVNWESAFVLYKAANDIIEGKAEELNVQIPCAAGASLTLERSNGVSRFTIIKNNETIPFVFTTQTITVKENGATVTKVIESGLGAFQKTIDGYLTGINADRHLDKMTEDYIKSLGDKANTGGGNNQGGYPPRNNNQGGFNRRPYNNNRNNYNRNNNQGQQPWQTQNTQGMSNYTPPQ